MPLVVPAFVTVAGVVSPRPVEATATLTLGRSMVGHAGLLPVVGLRSDRTAPQSTPTGPWSVTSCRRGQDSSKVGLTASDSELRDWLTGMDSRSPIGVGDKLRGNDGRGRGNPSPDSSTSNPATRLLNGPARGAGTGRPPAPGSPAARRRLDGRDHFTLAEHPLRRDRSTFISAVRAVCGLRGSRHLAASRPGLAIRAVESGLEAQRETTLPRRRAEIDPPGRRPEDAGLTLVRARRSRRGTPR